MPFVNVPKALACGLAAAGIVHSALSAGWTVSVSTTVNDRWFEPADDYGATAETELAVDPARSDQVMLGFGTAVSELSWKALSLVSDADRKAVLDEIFGLDGAAFTVIRTPIGSSDFAFGYYSYDDAPGDFAMEKFSIEIDERALLPLLREIRSRVPSESFRLWASPWCPPKWMKRNGHYAQRPSADPRFPNDCASWGEAVYIGEDGFRCDPDHYAAYARYFRRYVDAMKAKGFPIWMVMPQNESNSAQPYPSCTWHPATLADFTVNYLVPALAGSGTEVFAGTIEEGSTLRVHELLRSPKGRAAIKGAGFQWAGRGVIGAVHARYPDLLLMQTEHECNDGRNDLEGFLHSWDVVRGFIGQGASAYDYWNLALTDDALSTWGWAQNSLVTVDRKSRRVRFNLEYYLMKQLSHHVRRGAKRLLTRGDLDELAFANPDGSVVVMFANRTARPRAITVIVRGERLTANLPPESVSTFVR